MRKNTPKQRHWHCVRSQNQHQRKFRKKNTRSIPLNALKLMNKVKVRVFDNGSEFDAWSDRGPIYVPPETLDFDQAPRPSIQFLENVRHSLMTGDGKKWLIQNPRGLKIPLVGGYFDFSKIQNISTSCALVLAADYDRKISAMNAPPPLINVQSWNPNVLKKLNQIGFFGILGIDVTPFCDNSLADNDLMTVSFYCGSDVSTLEEADRKLLELAHHIDPNSSLPEAISLALNSAISEAMINVRRHAYPKNHEFKYKHLNKWWMAGSARKSDRTMTIAMYDQGASIPITYSKLGLPKKIIKFIKDRTPLIDNHNYLSDGVHIQAAVTYGNTQTQEKFRGKGLPQIKDAIDICGEGTLLIFSRGGQYIYESAKKEKVISYPHSIGGTLVEWTIKVPKSVEII